MLRKMLLEYIVRPAEVKEFEGGLEDHQRAQVADGGTVLERAVREHNVGACGKVSLGFFRQVVRPRRTLADDAGV
jgi:COP9 signalosome complex subunit 4